VAFMLAVGAHGNAGGSSTNLPMDANTDMALVRALLGNRGWGVFRRETDPNGLVDSEPDLGGVHGQTGLGRAHGADAPAVSGCAWMWSSATLSRGAALTQAAGMASMVFLCFSPHSPNGMRAWLSEVPRSVSEYSTFGGTWGYTSRCTRP
jgi:hypothetical protein